MGLLTGRVFCSLANVFEVSSSDWVDDQVPV